MTFFLDENFPKTAEALLASLGHEVLDIRGTDAEGAADTDIFGMAQEKQRDGASWTLLDERKDEPEWDKRNARRVFTVSNSTAYAHYRLEFLRVHDNAPMFQISEIALLPTPLTGGAITVAVPAATPESGVRVVKLEPKR